ncbi:MAG: DNA-binding XRE family transcriptional regulator [Saprospiraceae bacterium]|jgi:DNA-binding XRE family transcriptional regulator
MRTVKRIIKIHKIEGYRIFALFSNGESRIVDFAKLFKEWEVKKGDVEFPLKESLEEFKKVKVIDGTFVWENIEIKSTDEDGNQIVYHFDVDPIVMYESSEKDDSRKVEIGLMIKQARKELGLTQEQLASKSGTSKHYISRIENNKSGIELSTLVKIIEGGLGKRIQINIV